MTETRRNVRHRIVVRAAVVVLIIFGCIAIAWQKSVYRVGSLACRGGTVNEWLKSGDAKRPLRDLGAQTVLPYYKKLLENGSDSPTFFDRLRSLASREEKSRPEEKSINSLIVASLVDLSPHDASTMVPTILSSLARNARSPSKSDVWVELNARKFFCAKKSTDVMNELIKATRASDRTIKGYALSFLAEYGVMAKAAAPDLLADFKHKQDNWTLFALANCAPDLELLPPAVAQVAMMKDRPTHERVRAVQIMHYLGKTAAPFGGKLESILDETNAFAPWEPSPTFHAQLLDEFHAEVMLALEAMEVKEGQTTQLLKRFENAGPAAQVAAARLFWYRTNDITALEPTLKDLTRIPPETISSCFRYKADLSGFAADLSNTCLTGDHVEGIYLTVNSAVALFLREIGREDLLQSSQTLSEESLNHPSLEDLLYARALAVNADGRERYLGLLHSATALKHWKAPEKEALQALIKEMDR